MTPEAACAQLSISRRTLFRRLEGVSPAVQDSQLSAVALVTLGLTPAAIGEPSEIDKMRRELADVQARLVRCEEVIEIQARLLQALVRPEPVTRARLAVWEWCGLARRTA